MAKITRTNDDGATRTNSVLKEYTSYRAAQDAYLKLRAKFRSEETFHDIDANSFSYSEGIWKYTYTLCR